MDGTGPERTNERVGVIVSVCGFTLNKAFDLPVHQKRDMEESDFPKVSSPPLTLNGDGVVLQLSLASFIQV